MDKLVLQQTVDKQRDRLTEIVTTKIKTAFIGALAKFETHFGGLWGDKKLDSECTDDELYWRDIFEEARFEILNNGNDQCRAVEGIIHAYEVKYKGHSYNFRREK